MPLNQIILVAKGSAIQKIYYKVISGDMILQVDLDLEDSTPIFFEDSLAHADAFCCDLDLEHSNPISS